MAFQLQSSLHGHGVCLKLQTKLPTLFRCCLNADRRKKPYNIRDLQLQSPLHSGLPNHFQKGTWKIQAINVHPPIGSNVVDLASIMSSIFIKGHLPPLQQSIHLEAARKELMEYTERYKIKSFNMYVDIDLVFATFIFPGTSNSHRIAVITRTLAIAFVLDDMFYDVPERFPCEDYGVDRSIYQSQHKTREFIKHLNIVMRQEERPFNPTSIERMMWETGHDLRALSTPDWFNSFADAFVEYDRSSEDTTNYSQDLDTYTQFRFKNVGARFTIMLLEVARNEFLPPHVRKHPIIEQVTFTCGVHGAFFNDIVSYAKEVEELDHPCNVVSVLMESENLLLPQALWRAVDVENSLSHVVVKVASDGELLTWKSEVASKYVEGCMQVMSGNMYWHLLEKRYRHPRSIFPELRSESDLDVQLLQEIFLG